ncbi:hypothetical protein BDP81DRAFT_441200 [Colletotrichum phormii]|uniref:Uncharacterized protein n=1 Tax=Colletotrichum phormii TaxID=359342 RepID=A0AAI9ZDH8_9PEZI|nr:uncharacterized protein BDP81DRAFT_441200 [Colletotrichum phormii]KAK1622436.1 hypothetical protein BDP81DRAFT_441200 [Colletotrichum phormii]
MNTMTVRRDPISLPSGAHLLCHADGLCQAFLSARCSPLFPSPPLDVENLRVNSTTPHSLAVFFGALCSYTPGCHLVDLTANHSSGSRGAQDSSYPNCRVTNNETTRAVPCPCPPQSRIFRSKPMSMSRSPQRSSFHAKRCVYDEKPFRVTVKGYARDVL